MMARDNSTFDAVETIIFTDPFHNEHEFDTQTLVPVLVLQQIQGLKKHVKIVQAIRRCNWPSCCRSLAQG